MKAGPRSTQFEPVQGKIVKFSDVHGVDEAKDVSGLLYQTRW
jgi:ATP-dependent metalloprotease